MKVWDIIENILFFFLVLTIAGSINYAIQCVPIPECEL